MIIEFFGLPGTGKTTIMNNIINISLQQDGNIKKSISGKELGYINCLKSFFSFEFFCFVFKFIHILIKKKNINKYDIISVKYMIKIYVIYMQIRDYGDNGEYYCWDHGLLQSIISLFWDNETLDKVIFFDLITYVINKFNDKILFIYTKNDDVNELYNRIITRKQKIRLYFLPKEEVIRILEIQQKFLKEISLLLKSNFIIEVDTNENIKINLSKIFQMINICKEK